MTEKELKQLNKEGKIEEVKPEDEIEEEPENVRDTIEKKQFEPILETIRRIKQPVSTAPTVTPRNFIEQFVVYENGATVRIYIYVGDTWRYVALT